MPLVSITRFSARSLWFVPFFAFHAQRSIAQIRKANGCLSRALLRDKQHTFWTMTLWTDESAMKAYMTTGAHQKAMPKLAQWADEASVVHWQQDHSNRPSWTEAARRMRAEGRISKLLHPSPHHANMSFPDPWTNLGQIHGQIHGQIKILSLNQSTRTTLLF